MPARYRNVKGLRSDRIGNHEGPIETLPPRLGSKSGNMRRANLLQGGQQIECMAKCRVSSLEPLD